MFPSYAWPYSFLTTADNTKALIVPALYCMLILKANYIIITVINACSGKKKKNFQNLLLKNKSYFSFHVMKLSQKIHWMLFS